MTTWTKVAKPSGTSWTKISAPILNINISAGTPIGLLLALTYAGDSTGTSWTKLTKPSGTSWTKITKAT